jgi:mannose-1-phosphate guanylyltransferase
MGEESIMVSLHADHWIENREAFAEDLRAAVALAEDGRLGLIGIRPTSPHTGFGYIECGNPLPVARADQTAFDVRSFREKPDQDTARRYVEAGNFLWNSGMFFWKTSRILADLSTFEPEIQKAFESFFLQHTDGIPEGPLAETYSRIKSIAIDHAVVENAKELAVLPARFDWKDLGSFDAIQDCFGADNHGNSLHGPLVFQKDCNGLTVDSDAAVTACIGIQDVAVIVDRGCVLVVHRDQAQDIRKVVEFLRSQGRDDLL